MRRCPKCKLEKPVGDFGRDRSRRNGIATYCRRCQVVAAQIYKAKNPEKSRRAANNHRLKRCYGISQADYDLLLAGQRESCAICEESTCTTGRALAVDHDHETGKVRGLLCYNCNVALGLLKDCPDRLGRAIRYLEASRVH